MADRAPPRRRRRQRLRVPQSIRVKQSEDSVPLPSRVAELKPAPNVTSADLSACALAQNTPVRNAPYANSPVLVTEGRPDSRIKFVFEVVAVLVAFGAYYEARSQTRSLQEQLKLQQQQLQQQRQQDHVSRRAELFAILNDRLESCRDELRSAEGECPPKAHIRSREAALKSYVLLERQQPAPDLELLALDLRQALLNRAELQGVKLNHGHFERAELAEANLSMADLDDAHMEGANLIDAVLDRAYLNNAHLNPEKVGEIEQFTNLNNAKLQGAWLIGADLRDATLNQAQMNHAHLSLADLRGAQLWHADFDGADMKQTKLCGCDLLHTKNLTQQQLEQAHVDTTTVLPPNTVLYATHSCSSNDP